MYYKAHVNTTTTIYEGDYEAKYQHFYFLAKHCKPNDWDVQLQIHKCVACDAAVGCSTKDTGADKVLFWLIVVKLSF